MSKKHLNSVHVSHFKNTSQCATEIMPIPSTVCISMQQHIGAPCEPLVKVGDEVKVGQKIGDSAAAISAPIHSSVSGTVTAIKSARNANGGTDMLIEIAADGKQTVSGEIKVPSKPKDHAEFVQRIRESGLVGLGGAGFPTHVKMNPNNIDEVKTLIVNAAECEPYITSDHRALLEDADNILDGALLIMEYVGLDHGYIAIEDNKADAIEFMKQKLSERHIENIEVFTLKSTYPKGAERVLVYEISGKVMDAGVLPADLGFILDNVATVAFIGKYFATGMPLVTKRITVDGDAVTTAKNVLAPIGTSVKDLADFCGGYKGEPKKIIFGGPMMGRTALTDEAVVLKQTNAVLYFSSEKAYLPEETACISCGACTRACPFNLLPVSFAKAYKLGDVEALNRLRINQCMECGSCSYVCPAHRPLANINSLSKALVKEAAKNAK